MAECNTCGGYLSIEDKIRLSMKCDANGNVVWQGALLNQNEPDGTWTEAQNAQIHWADRKLIIKYFWIWGSKKTGYAVGLGLKTGMAELRISDIEKAIEYNELESKILSSDKALELLKKAKEKLDFNIIKQDEYDSIRLFLMKYIK